jgi:uncharacterized protein (TIGR00251 family)
MRIYVKVQARSSREKIEKISDQEYKIWTMAPPVRNAANKSIIKMLAVFFGISKNKVEIVGGRTTNKKMIDINLPENKAG